MFSLLISVGDTWQNHAWWRGHDQDWEYCAQKWLHPVQEYSRNTDKTERSKPSLHFYWRSSSSTGSTGDFFVYLYINTSKYINLGKSTKNHLKHPLSWNLIYSFHSIMIKILTQKQPFLPFFFYKLIFLFVLDWQL